MRAVFFGTPDFAVPTLKSTAEAHDVVAVVTQPDRKKNRGQKLRFSEVKEEALRLGIPVLQPERIADAQIPEADVYVVVAYGQIFPRHLLDAPRYGCFNLHASLLPRYRGAAPIQRAVEAGEQETGVCIMRMDAGLDTGDVLLCRSVACEELSAAELSDRLSRVGAQLMLEALDLIESGEAVYQPQGDGASYARMIKREDYLYRPNFTVTQIMQKIRAFGYLKAEIDGKNSKIFKVEPSPHFFRGEDSVVFEQSGVFLKAADGYLQILELQPENGKRMPARAYLLGRRAGL